MGKKKKKERCTDATEVLIQILPFFFFFFGSDFNAKKLGKGTWNPQGREKLDNS